MTITNTDILKIAFVPGNAEELRSATANNVLLSGMANNVVQIRNAMYVGVAATTAFAITSALTDGGYSLASAALATASAGLTALVAKNLYKTTSMVAGYVSMAMADGVARAGM
jgi:hypothetical protein